MMVEWHRTGVIWNGGVGGGDACIQIVPPMATFYGLVDYFQYILTDIRHALYVKRHEKMFHLMLSFSFFLFFFFYYIKKLYN